MSVISLDDGRPPTASHRVAAEVRALMGRYNVTQMQLSLVLGVTQSGVSKRLQGKTPFDANEIGLLADYFRVSPSVLFGEAPPPEDGGPSKSTLLRSYRILQAA